MKMKVLLSSVLISSIILVGCTQKAEEKQSIDTVSSKTGADNTTGKSEENLNYLKQENEYFERLSQYEASKDLTKINEKNSKSIDKDIFYMYDKDITDPNETKYPIDGAVEIGKDLLLEEKLEILCEAMKETYKKDYENGSSSEITIYIEDIVNNVAVVSIAERYPMHSYYARYGELNHTLNAPKDRGIEWFDKVVLVYDSAASQ